MQNEIKALIRELEERKNDANNKSKKAKEDTALHALCTGRYEAYNYCISALKKLSFKKPTITQ